MMGRSMWTIEEANAELDRQLAIHGVDRSIFDRSPTKYLYRLRERWVGSYMETLNLCQIRAEVWRGMRAAGVTYPKIMAACGLTSHAAIHKAVNRVSQEVYFLSSSGNRY